MLYLEAGQPSSRYRIHTCNQEISPQQIVGEGDGSLRANHSSIGISAWSLPPIDVFLLASTSLRKALVLSTLRLRPYQERGVAEIRAAFNHGARRVLFVLPTGGGKTTIFSYITSAAAAGATASASSCIGRSWWTKCRARSPPWVSRTGSSRAAIPRRTSRFRSRPWRRWCGGSTGCSLSTSSSPTRRTTPSRARGGRSSTPCRAPSCWG